MINSLEVVQMDWIVLDILLLLLLVLEWRKEL